MTLIVVALRAAPLVAAAAIGSYLLRRGSASARHALWTAAIIGHFALLAGSRFIPGWELPVTVPQWMPRVVVTQPPAAAPRVTVIAPTRSLASIPPAKQAAPGIGQVVARPELRGAPSPAPTTAPSRMPLSPWLLIWLAGAALVAIRFTVGTVRVALLARQGAHVEDGGWLALAHRIANQMGISRPLTLLRGNHMKVPVTWGVVYPVVLLPEESDGWPEERRRLVLVHEMAHVKRFDALTQLLSQLAVALFWFDPLVWLAARRMQVEREHACDDYVLRDGTRASLYADELLGMVRSLGSARNAEGAPALAALAMARRSEFEGRMLAILDPSTDRHTLSGRTTLAAAAIALLLIVPLAGIRPVAAQQQQEHADSVRRAQVVDSISRVHPEVAAHLKSFNTAIDSMRQANRLLRAATDSMMSLGFSGFSSASVPSLPTMPTSPSAPASPTSPISPMSPVAGLPRFPRGTRDRTNYSCDRADIAHSSGTSLSLHSDDNGDGHPLVEYYEVMSGKCTHAVLSGVVTFAPNDREIASLAPGARAFFEEKTSRSARSVSFDRANDGSIERRYARDGEQASFDADANEWVAGMIENMVRESGVNAPQRVARYRQQGGVEKALDEIKKISSDGSKRLHLIALWHSTPAITTAEADRAIRQGAITIGSDGDMRAVLIEAINFTKASPLAYEDALAHIGSDGDKRAVILALLQQTDGQLGRTGLRAASEIGSDGDKAAVLIATAGATLRQNNPELERLYFSALNSIGSDGDKRRVLMEVLRIGKPSASVLNAALESAKAIGSDGDKSAVLIDFLTVATVPATGELRDHFLAIAKSIGSDGDYRRVMNALDRR